MNSGSEPGFPWNEHGIAPTRDVGEIRRAYARRLRAIDTGADPAEFQALRQAYEAGWPKPPANGRVDRHRAVLAAASGQRSRAYSMRRSVNSPRSAAKGKSPPRWPWSTACGGACAVALEDAAALEGRLFSAAIGDPEMPPALLAELGRRFRWNAVGSALEQHRPELYNRYLHRVGSAHARLNHLKGLTKDGTSSPIRRYNVPADPSTYY
jgi:hypothetical protein